MEPVWQQLDPETSVTFLNVPSARLVTLQAIVESYEGAGLVRTLDIQRGLVCILAATPMRADCSAILSAVQAQTGWIPAARPDDLDPELLFGYFKKEHHA